MTLENNTMNKTVAPAQGGAAPPRAVMPSGQPQAGAEYGEAGDPEQVPPQAQPVAGSMSLQAGSGQGEVSGRRSTPAQPQAPAMRPLVDIFEDEGGVTLLADLPGVPRDRLELRVDGDTLVMEGTADVSDMPWVHAEMLSPRFERSFTLSREWDPKQIEATLEHGVLKLRLHKVAQAQAKRIEVKAL